MTFRKIVNQIGISWKKAHISNRRKLKTNGKFKSKSLWQLKTIFEQIGTICKFSFKCDALDASTDTLSICLSLHLSYLFTKNGSHKYMCFVMKTLLYYTL